MRGTSKQPLFCGIIPPLATPLLAQDVLDIDGLERLIDHVVAGGVSGIFVLGTTGEAPSLSRELRLQVIQLTCRIAGGRVPVLVGITDTSYTEAVQLGFAAAEAGAAAVVVAPPFYFTYTQDDLLRYVEELVKKVTLPVVLYNVPQYTKIEYAIETVRRASQIATVVGLKDSSGSLAYLSEVVRGVEGRPDFSVLIGPEEKLADGMRAGACGGVCGGANLFPRLFVRIYAAARCADWATAERLQEIAREISRLLYTTGSLQNSYLRGLKAALSAAGICSGLLALPFSSFSENEVQRVEAGLERVRSSISPDPAIGSLLSS